MQGKKTMHIITISNSNEVSTYKTFGEAFSGNLDNRPLLMVDFSLEITEEVMLWCNGFFTEAGRALFDKFGLDNPIESETNFIPVNIGN